ncbi:hypothetical protein ACIBKY_43750 [Nonomuraea sp. NPDC050394]
MDMWFIITMIFIGAVVATGMSVMLVAIVRRQLRETPERWLRR